MLIDSKTKMNFTSNIFVKVNYDLPMWIEVTMTKGVKFTIYIISYEYINGYENRMDLSSVQNIPKQLKMVKNKNVNF